MTQTLPTTIVDEHGNHINPTSDEVIKEEMGLTVINPVNPLDLLPGGNNLPPHFQLLKLEGLSPEEQAEKIDAFMPYLGSTHDLIEYANLEIEAVGAALIWNPPGESRTNPDGPLNSGYWNSRLLLANGTLIESSSGKVTQALTALIYTQGQGNWKRARAFKVVIRPDGHYLDPVKKNAAPNKA